MMPKISGSWFIQPCGTLFLSLTLWRLAALGFFLQKKNTETQVALHGNFSVLVSPANLVKSSKDVASLVACTRKK